ncbi:ABC transporter ATP-binding protein [Salipiger mucosus]|uniref:Capsular polysaccharide ABC transporter, ATP-binding protein KpsT n=1 Tax=Salipiger mucosus DSM 16094 TaxID=1123237 RepID=S9Q9D6_9RHOB|nr:ABC transporter ATP-binding protein [Salipiger mucosus]EPX77986.1 Capsular polysaccharide ABC transporter, ATP-binding protein KpsT [Salipiger mucosus DSM 16094]
MLEFQNVTKFFRTPEGRKYILDDVSLDIEADKGLCILGMNGAGKSTLVKMISGTELPNAGRIIPEGKVSWPMGLSGSFQPSMTGRENVEFVARIYGQDVGKIMGEVEEFSELGGYMDMPVQTYSSGMKSRLAFGLSLAVSFDIYLIDEIISVGDRLFKEKSRKALLEKVQSSRVVLISHHESTVREFCDRCALLRHGRLELFDTVDSAFKEFNSIEDR